MKAGAEKKLGRTSPSTFTKSSKVPPSKSAGSPLKPKRAPRDAGSDIVPTENTSLPAPPQEATVAALVPDTDNKGQGSSIDTQPTPPPSYLLPTDPSARQPLVAYSAHARAYIPVPQSEQDLLGDYGGAGNPPKESTHSSTGGHPCEDGLGPDPPSPASPKLRNGLSHIARGVQTSHWPSKERAVSTDDRHTEEACGSCSPWEIYDAYMTAPSAGKQRGEEGAAVQPEGEGHTIGHSGSSALSKMHSARVCERAIFQNLNAEVASDFKYWDDPADASRETEGTLLPLWTFAPTSASGRAVTAIAWSPRQADLFAAGYGSFDPGKPVSGLVCIHSLMDASKPECQVALPSGVMCIDFHPSVACLLAVGCHDGSVHVVEIGHVRQAIRASCHVAERHGDSVWAVRWVATRPGEPLRFQSAASDGRLAGWELTAATCLQRAESIDMGGTRGGSGGATVCCLDAHYAQPSLLLVGTQEGEVLQYITDVGADSLKSFTGHEAPVYSVRWSPLHPHAFLTASADWSVKIWDATSPEGRPALEFDLGAPVGDAAWAPQSSTVFAAVNDSGKVAVYDLSVSTDWPLCKQKVAHKAALTKVAFSPRHPVLLVGDDKGVIVSLKLSPNLRKVPMLPKELACKPAAESAAEPGRQDEGASSQATSEAKLDTKASAAFQKERLHAIIQVAASCRATEREHDARMAALFGPAATPG